MAITAQLHDGTRLEFPDGTDPAVIQQTVQKVMSGKQQAPAGTAPSQLKGSTLGGVFMGLRDPIDAGAQLLVRALPDGLVQAGNRLNNKLADLGVPGIAKLEGSDAPNLSGIVLGKQSSAASPVDRMVRTANAEYDASRQMAGRDGIDLARAGGNLANPINRLVPMSGATSAVGVALRAGLQGAISGAAQPVLKEGDFASEKAAQIGIGGAAGAVGGVVADKLVAAVGNKLATLRARPGFPAALGGRSAGMPVEAQVDQVLAQIAQEGGFDLASIPSSILDNVKGQVTQALKNGQSLDPKALGRATLGKSVLGEDAGLMLGQATRDPQQFATEVNLRGINGAGKPISDRLNLQNERLIGAVAKRGATGAPDNYDAGSAAIKSLQALDEKLSGEVGAAYQKFRSASGSTIDVPLQPVAQRLGEVLDTYGKENIPAAVLQRLEGYGLMGGKQTKVFDLLEADKLIKSINANIDPLKGPQASALGQLRKGLSEAIDLADTQSSGATGPAAEMLREAIGKAKSRFSLHEAVPALEAAAKDKGTQEAFVQQFITSKSAGIDTVGGLVKLLSPEAMDGVKRNVLANILEAAAPGAARGSDTAKFSQAGFRKALDAIGDRKLTMLFGEDGLAQLRQIEKVSQWIQSPPAAAAVNASNTTSAGMNLLQGLAGKSENKMLNRLSSLPGLNIARNSLATSLDEAAAGKALKASVKPQAAKLEPEEVNALRRLLAPVGGVLGSASAAGFR